MVVVLEALCGVSGWWLLRYGNGLLDLKYEVVIECRISIFHDHRGCLGQSVAITQFDRKDTQSKYNC